MIAPAVRQRSRPLIALALAAGVLAFASVSWVEGAGQGSQPLASALSNPPSLEATRQERDGSRLAAMQALVTRLSDEGGATVESMEALAADDREGFARIGLRVQVAAPYARSIRLLAVLSRQPGIWFGPLDLRRAAGIDDVDTLTLTVTLFTYGAADEWENAGHDD
jgi:hypothetical protein